MIGRGVAVLLAAAGLAPASAGCGGDDSATPFFDQECPPFEATDAELPAGMPRLDGAEVLSVSRVNDVDLSVQAIDGTTISAVKDRLDRLRPADADVLHDEEEQYDTELSWQADGELWITAARVVCAGRVEVRLSSQQAPE